MRRQALWEALWVEYSEKFRHELLDAALAVFEPEFRIKLWRQIRNEGTLAAMRRLLERDLEVCPSPE